MKRTSVGGLIWTADPESPRWKRGKLRLFPHRHGRWVATAPGCSAVADEPDAAVKLLRERIASAARDLKLEGNWK